MPRALARRSPGRGYFDAVSTRSTPAPHDLHYPPRTDPQTPRRGAHKDYGYLALLQQDDVGGLQVQAADGGWIDARPVPDAFVFNIGEMLEIATRGYLVATRHRVVSPQVGVDRYSIPFFLGPRLDAVVEPLNAAARAGRGGDRDQCRPGQPVARGIRENALDRRLRSHPRVAQKWWYDVLARREEE